MDVRLSMYLAVNVLSVEDAIALYWVALESYSKKQRDIVKCGQR